MELKDLYRLVRKGEGETLEFKRKAAHPEKIMKEVVAFANTRGGDLLIGVDDNGTIPGVKYADEEIFVLNKALFTLCKPKVKFKYQVIPLDEEGSRSVVHYEILESKKKPHYALPDTSTERGKAYIRVLDKSIQASREVRNIIKLSSRKSAKVFTIEEEEKMLLKYLDEHSYITLSQFQKLSGLNKYKASRILITLVLSNVLHVKPSDKEDVYCLAPIVNY
jgi:predicted HTH transcriptional regulator